MPEYPSIHVALTVPDQLYARLVVGDARALARAISLVEDGAPAGSTLLAACAAGGRRARRIGVTGPPGAGKSTLVDQMLRCYRMQGKTVAVLAVDPSSPLTGGALLGDRIRMQGFAHDPGVTFRSMGTRGALGGLSRATAGVCQLLEAAGYDVLLIETVGVGQDEVAVAALADVTAVVLVPGMGDAVQSMKAGILEVADVFVINKADLPGAEEVEQEILAMQSLSCSAKALPPIVRTVASTGQGASALLDILSSLPDKMLGRPVSFFGEKSDIPIVIDHIGIAVDSIVAAREFYSLLGLEVQNEETVEHEQVRTAMLAVGASRLELLEPAAADSSVGRFLARRGAGLHHVALRVSGLDQRFALLQAAGVRLASDRVLVGAGGHRYFFVHPAATGGVLLELVEASA